MSDRPTAEDVMNDLYDDDGGYARLRDDLPTDLAGRLNVIMTEWAQRMIDNGDYD
jgi:hypothetical protein